MCAERRPAGHHRGVRVALTAAVSVAVAVAALGATTHAATTASGLRGLVLRGPITPVCRVGESCEAPAAHVTLVFSHAGRVVARTRTGADGRYRVTLAPGRYAVRTTRTGFERTVSPARVTVPTGRYARVTFRIDTGIR